MVLREGVGSLMKEAEALEWYCKSLERLGYMVDDYILKTFWEELKNHYFHNQSRILFKQEATDVDLKKHHIARVRAAELNIRPPAKQPMQELGARFAPSTVDPPKQMKRPHDLVEESDDEIDNDEQAQLGRYSTQTMVLAERGSRPEHPFGCDAPGTFVQSSADSPDGFNTLADPQDAIGQTVAGLNNQPSHVRFSKAEPSSPQPMMKRRKTHGHTQEQVSPAVGALDVDSAPEPIDGLPIMLRLEARFQQSLDLDFGGLYGQGGNTESESAPMSLDYYFGRQQVFYPTEDAEGDLDEE